jgi:NADH pyrophosphatase NudC (nudix superfamily)
MAEKEYIEREALLSYPIRRDNYDRKNSNIHFINGIESILEYAESLPSADVQEVRHGKNLTKAHPVDEFICSECGYMTEDCTEKKYSQDGDYCYLCEYEYKFCPNCGAKMDLER